MIDGRYTAKSINGPWTRSQFNYDSRDRKNTKQKNYLHNNTFAQREDGSFLMVNRHGQAWFSKDGLSSHYDFLPTLADLVGEEAPDGKDGISYLPTLLGKSQAQTHDFVVVNNRNNRMGTRALITREGFKLVEADRKNGVFQLYNIREDNEERNDLASRYPERTERLKQILEQETDSQRPDLL